MHERLDGAQGVCGRAVLLDGYSRPLGFYERRFARTPKPPNPESISQRAAGRGTGVGYNMIKAGEAAETVAVERLWPFSVMLLMVALNSAVSNEKLG